MEISNIIAGNRIQYAYALVLHNSSSLLYTLLS